MSAKRPPLSPDPIEALLMAAALALALLVILPAEAAETPRACRRPAVVPGISGDASVAWVLRRYPAACPLAEFTVRIPLPDRPERAWR